MNFYFKTTATDVILADGVVTAANLLACCKNIRPARGSMLAAIRKEVTKEANEAAIAEGAGSDGDDDDSTNPTPPFGDTLEDHEVAFEMLMGMCLFKYGLSNINKPYHTAPGSAACAIAGMKTSGLSIPALAALHGHSLKYHMTYAGEEALIYLVVYKVCLGLKKEQWCKDNPGECQVTPTFPGAKGSAATYQAADCVWFLATKKKIEQARAEEGCKAKKQCFMYFDYQEAWDRCHKPIVAPAFVPNTYNPEAAPVLATGIFADVPAYDPSAPSAPITYTEEV